MITLTPNLFTISMGKKFKIVAMGNNVNEANETVTMIFIAETKPFMLQEFPKGAVIMDFL